jgi:hypothetical protein
MPLTACCLLTVAPLLWRNLLTISRSQPKAKKEEGEVIKSSLAAQLKDGEMVFGVAHLFASFNDTFVVS